MTAEAISRPTSARGPCPLCGSTNAQVELDFSPIYIRRCSQCGFKFADPVLDAEALEDFYTSGYHGSRHAQGQEINGDVNVNLLKRLLPSKPGAELLDVGSGFGFLPAALNRTTAFRASGVELSDVERTYAAEELGVETHASLADVPSGKRYFAVTAFEVIEHIADPPDFVRALADRVEDGGYLVVGTDNFGSAAARRLGRGFPKWIPHQHISCFDPNALERAFASAPGLTITRRLSYTQWDICARVLLHVLTGGRKGGRTFSLEYELETETSRPFRFYKFRRATNSLWARLTLRDSLDGAMMIIVARKTPTGADSTNANS